jgi:hypothetical protein
MCWRSVVKSFKEGRVHKSAHFGFNSSSIFPQSNHLSTLLPLLLFILLLQPLYPIDIAPRKRIKNVETSDDVTNDDTDESILFIPH